MSFCSVSRFFNKSYKCRPWEDVIREIEENKLKTVLFVDDNMVSEKEELKTFLKEFIPLKIKWASQTSINMVNDRELLKIMADSGCIGNLIGFESININSLDWFNKSPNTRNFNQYAEAIEILRDYGFMTWASFIMGNDFDTLGSLIIGWDSQTKEIAQADSERFIALNPTFYQVVPLHLIPGTALWEQMKQSNRIPENYQFECDGISNLRHESNPMLANRASQYRKMIFPVCILAFSSRFLIWGKGFGKSWSEIMRLFARTAPAAFSISLLAAPIVTSLLASVYLYGTVKFRLSKHRDQPASTIRHYSKTTVS